MQVNFPGTANFSPPQQARAVQHHSQGKMLGQEKFKREGFAGKERSCRVCLGVLPLVAVNTGAKRQRGEAEVD